MLISVSTETKDFTHITHLHDRGMHMVCFDRVIEDLKTHKVIVDNFKGAYDATVHLINNGYTRIAHLGNSEYLSITKERQSGYKKALEDHKIEYAKT
jgi:LacI family transcriptional regulator